MPDIRALSQNTFIKGVHLCNPATAVDGICDIQITDGKIAAIQERLVPEAGSQIIHGTGLTAFPGLTDIHCHFRDPGWPEKEDIESGCSAALRGGVTTVVCMANTKPVADRPEILRGILEKGDRQVITLLQNSAMTVGLKGQTLVDADAMLAAGACGFSDDGIPIADPAVMEQALRTVKERGAILSVHEELAQLVLSPGVNQGPVSQALHVGGAGAAAEYAMVERDLQIQKKTGGKLHFQHISTGRSIELIRRAKQNGQSVTAEVTPQHLSLTEEAVLSCGSNAKLNPPLRGEEDRQALLRGVADGTVDVIATDHAPHTAEEKARSLTDAPSGLIGLETSLAICFSTLVSTGLISRLRLAELMCCKGAELYGLKKSVEPGMAADITLFDERETWVAEHFWSKASNTPYAGKKLCGKVKYVLCNGYITAVGQ